MARATQVSYNYTVHIFISHKVILCEIFLLVYQDMQFIYCLLNHLPFLPSAGSRCDIKLNPCSLGPCQNGGRCRAVSGGNAAEDYECLCAVGFEGLNCEVSRVSMNREEFGTLRHFQTLLNLYVS